MPYLASCRLDQFFSHLIQNRFCKMFHAFIGSIHTQKVKTFSFLLRPHPINPPQHLAMQQAGHLGSRSLIRTNNAAIFNKNLSIILRCDMPVRTWDFAFRVTCLANHHKLKTSRLIHKNLVDTTMHPPLGIFVRTAATKPQRDAQWPRATPPTAPHECRTSGRKPQQ